MAPVSDARTHSCGTRALLTRSKPSAPTQLRETTSTGPKSRLVSPDRWASLERYTASLVTSWNRKRSSERTCTLHDASRRLSSKLGSDAASHLNENSCVKLVPSNFIIQHLLAAEGAGAVHTVPVFPSKSDAGVWKYSASARCSTKGAAPTCCSHVTPHRTPRSAG